MPRGSSDRHAIGLAKSDIYFRNGRETDANSTLGCIHRNPARHRSNGPRAKAGYLDRNAAAACFDKPGLGRNCIRKRCKCIGNFAALQACFRAEELSVAVPIRHRNSIRGGRSRWIWLQWLDCQSTPSAIVTWTSDNVKLPVRLARRQRDIGRALCVAINRLATLDWLHSSAGLARAIPYARGGCLNWLFKCR
jgi:hypothetical protein